MALDAGVMSVTMEFAQNLKDGDWFGKQDPYCIVTCGGQTFRTKTAVDGGKNPVWNQTFAFNVINENSIDVQVKDEDVGKDDLIGTATFTLAKARESGSDRIQVPVVSKKSRKQHGFISVSLKWAPNSALRPAAAQAPVPMPYPAPYPGAPYVAAPYPYPYPAPYPAPYPPAPGAYYAPPPAYAYQPAPPAQPQVRAAGSS